MITESAAAQWDLELADLFLTIGHPFGRVELRCRMWDYVRGLLARSPARTAGCATRPPCDRVEVRDLCRRAVAAAGVEAEGSPSRGTPVRTESSPDNAGTARYCQTRRVRQARPEGVRRGTRVKPRKSRTGLKSGGYGPGVQCVTARFGRGGQLRSRSPTAGGETTLKVCGVGVVMLPG